MQRYAFRLSYLGTNYCGWQRQKPDSEHMSIQEILEKTIIQMTQEEGSFVASGRTDAGVHATGQVVHFTFKKKEWDLDILQKGLNALLPKDIQILEIKKMAANFHSQKNALKKQYSYYFQQGPCALPHLEPYSWWIRKKLNIKRMHQALQILCGKHDFKALQASGSKPGSTVREILEADVKWVPISFPLCVDSQFGLVQVRVVGSGFLKQMVRGIVGTLLQIGEERRPPDLFEKILDSKKRSLVGPTAPGRGLWLERVWYVDF